MYIDWSSVAIVVVTVLGIVGYVYFGEKAKVKKESLFPLFKLTDKEAYVLIEIYGGTWDNPYLCGKFADRGLSHTPLKTKIDTSLEGSLTLEGWRYFKRGINIEITEKKAIELRKQWIVALLEYNNMQEKLK